MTDWWAADPVASSGRPQITVTGSRQPDFASAISGVESGGRYDALGPQTKTVDRAFGKYQVMGANIGPWSEKILGRSLTPDEFLSSPEAQDAVFQGVFGEYAQKYGPEGAARAWFAGEGGMNNPNARDQLGTSVAQYGQKFSQNLSGPSSAGAAGNWWANDPPAEGQAAAPVAPAPTQPEQAINGRSLRAAQDMPEPGAGEALGRAAAKGLTANFYDEMRGLMEAGGLNPNDPASLSALIKGAVRLIQSDPEAAASYETATGRERSRGELPVYRRRDCWRHHVARGDGRARRTGCGRAWRPDDPGSATGCHLRRCGGRW
jgi:hypothetical protein